MNLAHGPREGHDVDSARPGLAQCRGSGGYGCATRVDVVDEHDTRRRVVDRPEGSSDISAALLERQSPLAPALGPREQSFDLETPALAKLAGEPRRRMVTSFQATLAVRRHERQSTSMRLHDHFCDDRGGEGRGPTKSVLLPRGHELRDGAVVRDSRPGGAEGEPPAGALAAAGDRPGRRGAAPATQRIREQAQPGSAAGAEDVGGYAAGGAAAREEQIEERLLTLLSAGARVRNGIVD